MGAQLMLSRVADNLYWMARYLERAEHTARVLDVHLTRMLEEYGGESREAWGGLIESLGLNPPEGLDEHSFGHWLTFDIAHQSSIVSCIMSARDNSRQVREQISSEMWEQLNRLFHRVRSASLTEEWSSAQQDFLNEVKDAAHLFQGITDSTMNHGEGWQFIQIGRFLERAVSVASLVGVQFRDDENLDGIAVLKSCTAFEAYCKVYTADVRPMQVADFLLLNAEFPHSVRFAADQIETALKTLPLANERKTGGKPLRLAGKLKATLSFSQMDEIYDSNLQPFLADMERQFSQVHNAMHQIYVDYPVEAAIEA